MTPLLFMYFRAPARWTDIVKRTVHEIGDDNCLGLAAQLAFYFLLALFHAILFLVALAFVLIGPAVTSRAAAWFGLAPHRRPVPLSALLQPPASAHEPRSSLTVDAFPRSCLIRLCQIRRLIPECFHEW